MGPRADEVADPLVSVQRRRVIAAGVATLALPAWPYVRQAAPRLVFQYSKRAPKNESPQVAVACWEDGSVLFSASREEPGKQMRFGKIETETVRAAVRRFDATGLFSEACARPMGVPDTATWSMVFWPLKGASKGAWWDEVVDPAWGDNHPPTEEYEDFVGRWNRARVVSCLLFPKEAKAVADLDKDALEDYKLEKRAPLR